MSEKQRQKKAGEDKNKKNRRRRVAQGPQSRAEEKVARKRVVGGAPRAMR